MACLCKCCAHLKTTLFVIFVRYNNNKYFSLVFYFLIVCLEEWRPLLFKIPLFSHGSCILCLNLKSLYLPQFCKDFTLFYSIFVSNVIVSYLHLSLLSILRNFCEWSEGKIRINFIQNWYSLVPFGFYPILIEIFRQNICIRHYHLLFL